MRGLALNHLPHLQPPAAVPPGAGFTFTHGNFTLPMKALETVISIVAFILLAIVLFALSPLLIKLIEVTNRLNHFFGN